MTSNETVVEGTVRLVSNSGPHKGRVELFLLGQWGTVCGNGWDLADAMVVCHQLGYLRAVGAPRSAAFGVGSGSSWYRDVACTGNESSLNECNHYMYNSFGSTCPHSQDAGVVCTSELLYNIMYLMVIIIMMYIDVAVVLCSCVL